MKSTFPEILKRTRQERCMNQAELAAKCNFPPSAISHFEAGRRLPSFDNLKRLADALNVNVDYLLGRQTDARAVGPTADRLFRDFERMSDRDREALANMAEVLADRNNVGQGGREDSERNLRPDGRRGGGATGS